LPRLASEAKRKPPKKRPALLRQPLPLLGSNPDSPDPEGPVEFQQLASIYPSWWHPMLEFAGFHAGLRHTLLTQVSNFAGRLESPAGVPGTRFS
jgi:hypothetical protein